MSIINIITLLGGVALFLFGMSVMSDGLKKVAGSKLERYLYKLSNTPLKGVLLGAGVTAIIQSSSATSVMVVGFVNSGIMKVNQAMTVIMGAIVGTSITGWIICLSYMKESSGFVSLLSTSSITAIVAIIGTILRMVSKDQTKRQIGDILLGFSVLMYGMQSMSGAVAPLKDSPSFIKLMTTFSNPILGIIAGAIFTAILQSSSAAVGILQALSITGTIDFAEAYPIILGIGIGAAVPVLFSAIGARTNGRRTAWSYLIIPTLGVIICAAGYYILDALIGFNINNMVMNPVNTSLVNTIFRVICVALLLPFTSLIEKLLNVLFRESIQERKTNVLFNRLDERFLQNPTLAVEQSQMTINAMARMTKENLFEAISLISDYNDETASKVEQKEELIDQFEDKIGTYLMKLNSSELNPSDNKRVFAILHTINDFERIGDHSLNICQVAQAKNTKEVKFSDAGKNEMETLIEAIKEIIELSFSAFMKDDLEKAYYVEPLEERVDVLCNELKLRHVERLRSKICSLEIGFVFNDLITHFERSADHCSNIAIAIIELSKNEYQAHDCKHNLKELHSNDFDSIYANYSEKYKV